MASLQAVNRLRPPSSSSIALAGTAAITLAQLRNPHLYTTLHNLSRPTRHASLLARRAFTTTRPLPAKPSSLPTSSARSSPDRTFERAQLAKPRAGAYKGPRPGAGAGAGASTGRQPRTYIYGGDLAPAAQAAQARKQYPRMMPPPDSWMHWFLTSRLLHMWIALGVLSTLAVTVFMLEFRRNTIFAAQLPAAADYLWHPLASVRTTWSVYQRHVDHVSQQTQAARDRNIEDARKRKAYRVAHGLERPETGLQANVDGVDVTYGEKVADPLSPREQAELDEQAEFERKVKAAYRESVIRAGGDPEVMEKHREPREGPREVKKWFGIW